MARVIGPTAVGYRREGSRYARNQIGIDITDHLSVLAKVDADVDDDGRPA